MLPRRVVCTAVFIVVWCWRGDDQRVVAARPPLVEVSKCCRVGETLTIIETVESDKVNTDSSARWTCLSGGPALWAPLVYAPMRRSYLPRGTVPQHWRVVEAHRPECAEPELVRSDPAPTFLLFANGSMWMRERALPPPAFCADTLAALVCLEPNPPARPATLIVHKCCGEGATYDETRGSCAAEPLSSVSQLAQLLSASSDVKWEGGFPACPSGSSFAVLRGSARLLGDGSLTLEGRTLTPGAYCLEAWAESAVTAVACAERVVRGPDYNVRFTLYPVGLLVSAAFLAATLAAGFALPQAHHALHWRCQTHYVAALLLADVLLATAQLAADRIPSDICVALAVSMHFLFLSAFFWLNIMCFNIWWIFRDFRPTSLEKSQESCRLRVYSLYGWGGPLLIAGVAALLDRLPLSSDDAFLRPRFGEHRCWFYGDSEILAYFFGPVGVLLCVNLVLFVSTARQLTCGVWRRDDVKSTTERAALGRICAKLVVVMGVTWVADVVSWGVGGPEYVWYVTDLINALQGVFIFTVVTCQPQVWANVKRIICGKQRTSASAQAAPLHSSQVPSCGDTLTHNTAAPSTSAVKVPIETVC